MFYIEKDNKIILSDEDKQKLQDTIAFMPQYKGLDIQEVPEGYVIYDFELMTVEEKEAKEVQIENERIQALSMTPLDFIKALEQFAGITYDQIKKLCDTYPEIDRELRFCQNVYRSNPMFSEEALAKLPKEFHLTQEQIDNLFVAVDNMKRV